MSGQFRTFKLPPPPTKPTTRLQLIPVDPNLNICAHLSCQTLVSNTTVGALAGAEREDNEDGAGAVQGSGDGKKTCTGLEFYEHWKRKLGQDPLREDADPDIVWEKLVKSKKSIGISLMDQTMIAGVGNIYRAEILYKSSIHPSHPSNLLTRAQFDTIWHHSVDLLQRGYKSGSILTVDPADAKRLGPPWTRRYVYNHSKCGNCKSSVVSYILQSRKAYVCPKCQPLPSSSSLGESLPSSHLKSLASAKPVTEFASHCAREGPETLTPAKMTVAELKKELNKLGVSFGKEKKAGLVGLLENALKDGNVDLKDEGEEKEESVDGEGEDGMVVDGGDLVTTPAPSQLPTPPASTKPRSRKRKVEDSPTELVASKRASRSRGAGTVQPGTSHLGEIVTSVEAAREKALAGESKAVEHVALIVQDGIENADAGKKGRVNVRRSRGKGAVDTAISYESTVDLGLRRSARTRTRRAT